MKVGITGASGMLGNHLLKVGDKRGVDIVSSSRSKPEMECKKMQWNPLDLTDTNLSSALKNIFSGVSCFIHAGAQTSFVDASEEEMFRANVDSTKTVAEFCLENKVKLVYISGAIVYSDETKASLKEDDPVQAKGFGGYYRETKFLAEEVLQEYVDKGLKLVILRPTSIYGYGLGKEKMINKFLNTALEDAVINLKPPVEDRVNLVHAEDVAEAAFEVLKEGIAGVFNIGYTEDYSVKEIADICCKVINKGKVVVESSSSESAPKNRFQVNCQKAKETWGFAPQVSLEKGIELMSEGNKRCINQ